MNNKPVNEQSVHKLTSLIAVGCLLRGFHPAMTDKLRHTACDKQNVWELKMTNLRLEI